ncbi:hypothetical protein ACJX0J_036867 [Zea mays]
MCHVEGNKLEALKAYRRAKGLCFKCGEKWGHNHRCLTSVLLHFVEEMRVPSLFRYGLVRDLHLHIMRVLEAEVPKENGELVQRLGDNGIILEDHQSKCLFAQKQLEVATDPSKIQPDLES